MTPGSATNAIQSTQPGPASAADSCLLSIVHQAASLLSKGTTDGAGTSSAAVRGARVGEAAASAEPAQRGCRQVFVNVNDSLTH